MFLAQKYVLFEKYFFILKKQNKNFILNLFYLKKTFSFQKYILKKILSLKLIFRSKNIFLSTKNYLQEILIFFEGAESSI